MKLQNKFNIKKIVLTFIGAMLFSALSAHAVSLPIKGTPISVPTFNCKAMSPSDNYMNFESGPVRPIVTSEDKKLVFVANTAANCLEIYRARGSELTRISALSVGLDPVAVSVRNGHEVWVVNHMSDSVSIVDISGQPKVVNTLLVGDEPRDIVFAGTQQKKAFITTAHRGQNHPNFSIEDLSTPGLGRADVWVYNLDTAGALQDDTPNDILSLFTDTPRALAVSADKRFVYAAGFFTGNQTTVIMPQALDRPKAGPHDSVDGAEEPGTGLIVKFNGEHWVDELGQEWDNEVLLSLPDLDVFKIDADTNPPKMIQSHSGVGTVLFNMAVNPISGAIYVSNTNARNEVRFEGAGSRSTSVRGHFLENNITVIKGSVRPVHLNPHVDFSLPIETESPENIKAHSISQPMFMQVSEDGEILFLTAFGSSHVVAISTKALEGNQYDPFKSQHMDVPGGPAGLAFSKNEKYLYVYSMFENELSVLETKTGKLKYSTSLYNPESDLVRNGRPFLYDATLTSGNGTVSCGGCHVFGDMDGLAWDLGNPDAMVAYNPLEESDGSLSPLKSRTFHPLKGPMTTQTFRGISLSGPMHWRGDRTGVNRGIVNGEVESIEAAAFKEFDEAFVGLLGRGEELNEHDLQKFTDFSLAIQSPPNPIANIDGTYTERQKLAINEYNFAPIDRRVSSCNSCHKLNPDEGLFGTDKKITSEGPLVSQDFKIPHLRNMYQKVGMFGTTFLTDDITGPQVRGFGYGHDGTFSSLNDFLLKLGGFFFTDTDQAKRIAEFVFAFPSEQASSVGQQVTLSKYADSKDFDRALVLVQQDKNGQCDVMVSAYIFGISLSGSLDNDQIVLSGSVNGFSNDRLQALSIWGNNSMTYTCVPLGMGFIYGG